MRARTLSPQTTRDVVSVAGPAYAKGVGERSGHQGELQPEPARQVLDLVPHRGGHPLSEGNVLVDRVHPQHTGLAVGDGVELADQPVLVQDRQRQ
jgi:hypothetical protein